MHLALTKLFTGVFWDDGRAEKQIMHFCTKAKLRETSPGPFAVYSHSLAFAKPSKVEKQIEDDTVCLCQHWLFTLPTRVLAQRFL